MGGIFLRILTGFITAMIASAKGRNPIVWFFVGVVFYWLAPIVILFMPGRRIRMSRIFRAGPSSGDALNWRRQVEATCPYCGSRVVIDDIPGSWACPDCGRTFTYSADGRTYRIREDQVLPQIEWIVKLFAKLAKRDGVVTENEVRQVDRIVRQAFQPNEEQLSRIMSVFNMSRYSDETFEEIAENLYASVGGRRDILEDTLVALLAIASADGSLNAGEEAMIARTADLFGLGAAYASLKARFYENTQEKGGDLAACYRLLGCSEHDSDETIKKQYRQRIKENHPDRLVGRGASEESIRQANVKVTEIKRAFETIMAARG
ncbi:TerB family tellurite resistance protein [Sporolactobacillus sp. CQH2019]|uniref:TerB family tellurite resistance protein n=1 Tax=Sporolactobacillus sp. CQH2019 TaxID=3023512 RepID=UPI002367C178|nr:TerB family tellurite resistance protein [Sporolactobacillus sp. CQH2019]MDD9148396.1 TerB family tellurite resistance protein [Sporolactobacillus sp. CQH2019]